MVTHQAQRWLALISRKECLLLAAGVALLCACASPKKAQWLISDRFQQRQNPQGIVEFAYGLSWQPHPDYISSYSNRQTRTNSNREMLLREFSSNSKAAQNTVSNEQKMQLEDRAAQMLESRLREEELCDEGYSIDQVVWEENRVRLMGQCQ